MNSNTGLIAPLVQALFHQYLVRQRRASPQTVASYRDTFRLLIQHLSQTTGRKPSDLTLDDLQAKAIMRFLDGIERDRGNSVQTRNARLAAIRSFFRLVTLREPARLDLAAQVLAIPTKRADRRLTAFLTHPKRGAFIPPPRGELWVPRVGAVVTAAFSPALGVDRCPLTGPPTSFSRLCGAPCRPVRRVSPHVIRHTTAMHLLQSGVEIAVIALWLGHESLDTTHMYIQADLKTKEQALGKSASVKGRFPRLKPDDALLAF